MWNVSEMNVKKSEMNVEQKWNERETRKKWMWNESKMNAEQDLNKCSAKLK
jgi:hypothetical protein